MRHKGCASLGLWAFALLGGAAAAARAAPLQLQGELTINNRTDELPPDRQVVVPAGETFMVEVYGKRPFPDYEELWGQALIAPEFWPPPGQSYTGSIAVEFVSPGPGVISESPVSVDGLPLLILLEGTALLPAYTGTIPERFGESMPLVVYEIGPGYAPILGDGTLRVDAIVPEPGTACMGVCLLFAVAYRHRRRHAVTET